MGVRGTTQMRRVVNTFGATGYSLLILGYAMVLGGVLMWLVGSGSLETLGVPADSLRVTTQPPIVQTDTSDPSLVALIPMYVLSATIFLTVIFVTITLPYWLGKVGSYLLKRSIRWCQIPVTLKSLLIGKLLAVGIALVPVLIALMYTMVELPVSIFQVLVLGVTLCVFLIQHYLASTSEVVEAKDVW